jgi:hypothetical protein
MAIRLPALSRMTTTWLPAWAVPRVTPAQTGVQGRRALDSRFPGNGGCAGAALDSRVRGNDGRRLGPCGNVTTTPSRCHVFHTSRTGTKARIEVAAAGLAITRTLGPREFALGIGAS